MAWKSETSWWASCSAWFAALPGIFVFISGTGLVALAGWLDALTGPDMSFAVFYAIPVILIGWYGNQPWAIVMSCFSVAAWFGVNFQGHLSIRIFLWNALTRLGFFLIITLLVCALRRALERERIVARTDGLTGVLNSRAFYEVAESERQRALRYQHPLTMLYIDVDDFKSVNDQWGHQAGNEVLSRIAEILKNDLRSTDITARVGGDEFVVLLPEASPEAAQTTARKLRTRLLEDMKRAGWPMTFSIGVLTFVKPPYSVDAMVAEADALMSAVKRSGKNAMKYEIAVTPQAETSV